MYVTAKQEKKTNLNKLYVLTIIAYIDDECDGECTTPSPTAYGSVKVQNDEKKAKKLQKKYETVYRPCDKQTNLTILQQRRFMEGSEGGLPSQGTPDGAGQATSNVHLVMFIKLYHFPIQTLLFQTHTLLQLAAGRCGHITRNYQSCSRIGRTNGNEVQRGISLLQKSTEQYVATTTGRVLY